MSILNTLQLRPARRPAEDLGGGASKIGRDFLDFVVDDGSLWEACNAAHFDLISCLWLPTPDPQAVRRLVGQEPGNVPDGSCTLYICPECGDLGCGAVTVRITLEGERVIWHDFLYQNDYDPQMTSPVDPLMHLSPLAFDLTAYRALLMPLLVSRL